VYRDSIFNTSCDLWTKVRTSLHSKCYRHAESSVWCAGRSEAQSCEHIKFIKKNTLY
jgi:hypothetical protein